MNKVKKITAICVVFICIITLPLKASVTQLYEELNVELTKRDFYIDLKKKTINYYKKELDAAKVLEEQYRLSKILTAEYTYFNTDSLVFYGNKTVDLAYQMKDKTLYTEALIMQAYSLPCQGYFHETIKILESIDAETLTTSLQLYYYYAYYVMYYFRQEQATNAEYRMIYKTETLKYLDKCLSLITPETRKSNLALFTLGYKYYHLNDYKTALEFMFEALRAEDLTQLSESNVLYLIYSIYNDMGEGYEKEAQEYLLRSAILCVKLAKLSNPTLIQLALIQSNKGNYSLALEYIDAAQKNTELFQSKILTTKVDKAHITIREAYYNHLDKEQKILNYYAWSVSVLLVLIVGVFIYMLYKDKLTKVKYEKLLKNYKLLNIVNSRNIDQIKHYLNLSSFYINKLDEIKKTTILKINIKQSTDLFKSEIEAIIDIKEERLKLYRDFDETFYGLYPDFIEKVNSLLHKEFYFLENDIDIEKNRTSTELRILALIKVGINDNKQIASFLQFTVQSVYNYRSKIKARAMNPDTFEDDLDNI